MASVNVTVSVDEWYEDCENLKILSCINSNSAVYKKSKCGLNQCACACKENVNQSKDNCRKRSKSESHQTNNQLVYYPPDRARTYSVNRTMHDKGINVYVVPENMPELLLAGYNSKENLKWPHSADAQVCNEKGSYCQSISVSSNENRNGFDKGYDACQRERNVGIKRMRDESPSLPCGKVAAELKEGVSLKAQQKNIPASATANNTNGNGSIARQDQPIIYGVNGTSNEYRVDEAVPETAVNYCDTRIKSKRSKTFNSDCMVVSSNGCRILSFDSEGLEQKESTSEGTDVPDEECEFVLESKNSLLACGDQELHSGLRKSLFPNVPPFIKFFSLDDKVEAFPVHIHKLLRWKLSTITPLVVRKVVSNSGFRLLKKSTYWGGTWGKHTKSVGFKTLFDYQKMNHFPGTFQIGRKDRLWKSLQKLMCKHGKNKFDLMPTTYILPQDKKLLKSVWKKTEGKEPWIIKPPASARGTGIKVVHRWSQIPDNTPLIVQRYISGPYLINETKFDLRLYVLVTSVNPLRIYLYDNGLVRFASVKYSTELNTLCDRYMHLTNYSINKLSSKYKQNEDETACQGHKWTLKTLWTYMENQLKVDVSKIWTRLIDLIIKTIISGENSITSLSNSNLGSRYNSYELFGIDVLFDLDLKPWLLEVNISPSLHSASPLDLAVKAPLVRDLMNIVGFQIPRSKKFTESQLCTDMGKIPNNQLCYDNRLYTRILSSLEKQKHHKFVGKSREEYLEAILDDLAPDDVRHLIQYEDELTQLGSFQKIFPTSKTHEYLQYLESPRYYNLLFDAWETKYHKNREEGIQLLRSKCEERLHLQISKETTTSSKTCEILPRCQQRTQNSAFAENSKQRHWRGSEENRNLLIARPKRDRRKRNRCVDGSCWKFIVNTERHTQTVRIETCLNADRRARTYLNNNVKSHCAQIFIILIDC